MLAATTTQGRPPTAAALLTTLARFAVPAMRLRAVGHGAGSRDDPRRPNLVRCGGGEADGFTGEVAALVAAAPRHLITSAVEHHAVLHTCAYLERRHGFAVTYLPVDGHGRVDPQAVLAALRPDTALVSVMLANNEVGTVEPVGEIARLLRGRGILLHTDAVQAAGTLEIDVEALGVDLLVISAHKFGGPKGAGALYVRRGTPLDPLVHGGGQELGLRAGTESVANAAGLAAALRLAVAERAAVAPRLRSLRDRLVAGIVAAVPDALPTGHPCERLPGHAHVCFRDLEGESVLIELDARGICASAGSACSAGSTEPSHVLTAMGIPAEYRRGAVRLSLGRETTVEDVDTVVAQLAAIIPELRALAA